jgi:acetate kinase
MLNKDSGLLGLSGISSDVRELEAASEAGDERAEMALESFAYRAGKFIGAYAAALEGVDAIAFAGGIGEHSSTMRARICRRLTFLGIVLDSIKNGAAKGASPAEIGDANEAIKIWVIPTDEEREVARETFELLSH